MTDEEALRKKSNGASIKPRMVNTLILPNDNFIHELTPTQTCINKKKDASGVF